MNKLLIVDDDHVEVFMCERMIKYFAPNIATNSFTIPRAAIKHLIELKLQLLKANIILDINMPQMSGWDFLDECTKNEIDCNVYILSSSINPADKELADNHALVKGFFPKPLNKEHVIEMINAGFGIQDSGFGG